jgi:chromatin segregation and condensation protein Rec8/ScpA/Scc1 (kleisin family)
VPKPEEEEEEEEETKNEYAELLARVKEQVILFKQRV